MTKSVNSVLNVGRIFRALGYSWQGLRAAFQHEAAFRQELMACVLLVPLALYLGATLFERALLIASLLLVLVVEILNSAIEALVDWRDEAPHPMAGRAKDMGSAAVLLAMIITVLVWVGVLLPRVLSA
ncbi:MAG: diacylglycerol kinase [Proteobacteria bacterium]|nr:diacylglycerol kinase [Pseudomonadota bacterium]